MRTISSFTALVDSVWHDRFDPQTRQQMSFITESCNRMTSLIRGLLEYSRIGRQAESERIDLNDLVRDVFEDLGGSIRDAGASIEVARLPTLVGYPVELRLLFQNLLSNAIKFRRPTLAPVVKIDCERQRETWQISVSDNGIGIEPRYREQIFLIFQRLHSRDDVDGTGIGLAHCRKIVELHHGRIWASSSFAGGAKFLFTIPDLKEHRP